jgi:hypothetical protein
MGCSKSNIGKYITLNTYVRKEERLKKISNLSFHLRMLEEKTILI